MKQCKFKNKGSSLVNLLIMIAILSTIIGYETISYDNSSSKSIQMYNDMNKIKIALKNYKTDTGCYPVNLSSLLRKKDLNINYCNNRDISGYWNGPYLTGMITYGDDIDYSYINGKNSYGDGTWSNYVISTTFTSDIIGTGDKTKKQFIVAERAPSDIINKTMEICNKGYSDETHKKFKQGNCVIFNKGFVKTDNSIKTSLDKIKTTTSDYSIGMLLEEKQ